jgi:hypothetical protein
MPTHKKRTSAFSKSAHQKNDAVIREIFREDAGSPPLFARVSGNNGHYFRLTIHDGGQTLEILGSPRGLFKTRRANIRFSTNDIVVLSKMPESSSKQQQIHEIIALLDRESAQSLYDTGRIHKSVYVAPDPTGAEDNSDAFVFDYSADTQADDAEAEVDVNAL